MLCLCRRIGEQAVTRDVGQSDEFDDGRCMFGHLVMVCDHLLDRCIELPAVCQTNTDALVIDVLHEKTLDLNHLMRPHLVGRLGLLHFLFDEGHDQLERVFQTHEHGHLANVVEQPCCEGIVSLSQLDLLPQFGFLQDGALLLFELEAFEFRLLLGVLSAWVGGKGQQLGEVGHGQ